MTDPVATVPHSEPARWRTRATALAIDLLPGAVVVASMGMLALSLPGDSVWRWAATAVAALAFLATAVNRILLPAITGWSLGRALTGIEVARVATDAAVEPGPGVGPRRLLVREAAHLLDTIPVPLGWLWPLRDKRGRTFADMVARTQVRRATRERPVDIRRWTMAVFIGSAALSLLSAAGAYGLVYQRDHETDQARSQIARQGPKIVADMLSYDPETLQDDFDRAQSLVTEKYREQLLPQQDAIRNSKPAPNFYRVTDAAVLDAAPRRATMLLFLQGQRGVAGDERLISATVRVAFAQQSGAWRVDDLIVVSKPLPAEGDR